MDIDLFGNASGPTGSLTGAAGPTAPLAVRMRPRTIDELVGQQQLLSAGSPLRRLVAGQPMSVFLWGPPGVGKTTIASIVSRQSGARFVELSAVSAGVKEVRTELERSKRELAAGRATVLFIDEVHRFSKTQQDALLPAVENQLVTLVAATTENPSFSVISPLLSRSLLLRLQPLTDADIAELVARALTDERGLAGNYTLSPQAEEQLVRLAGGDARRALTYLEQAAAGASAQDVSEIDAELLAKAVDRALSRYDRGDQHYDIASAFIKSLRGSDVDAALHWLARMLDAGEDPRFVARRLMIAASEDVGMAASGVLSTCVAAAQAAQLIGMPEARIILGHATVAVASAPKSNAAYLATEAAFSDVRAGKTGPVPLQLRDSHYAGAKSYGHGVGYRYPHDYPDALVPQEYLPAEVASAEYYRPTDHGAEARVAERLRQVRDGLGRTSSP